MIQMNIDGKALVALCAPCATRLRAKRAASIMGGEIFGTCADCKVPGKLGMFEPRDEDKR